MSKIISSSNLLQLQDTIPKQEQPIFFDTLKTVKKIYRKAKLPIIDIVDHSEVDTSSYFFYKLVISKPSQDSILLKSLNDAPEFYVDSILTSDREELTTNYDEFKHYMKTSPKKEESLYSNSSDWIAGVLFIIVIVLLLTKTFKNNFISALSQLVLQYREFTKNVDKTNYSDTRINNLLTLTYSLSLGLLSYLIFHFFELKFTSNHFFLFLILIIFILAITYIKRVFILLSGFFLSETGLSFKYNKNILLLNNTLGLLIIPFILSIPFIEEIYVKFLIYSSISIVVLLYLFRISRSVRIFIEYNVSISYMILYLCTLEILPNLLMYKILVLFYGKVGLI